jgi:predicted CXXCH cytochrome family protein
MKLDLWRILAAILITSLLAVGGCEDGDDGGPGPSGPAGTDGAAGAPGADGTDGTDGTDGEDGADGEDGISGAAEIGDFHGTAMLLSSGEFKEAGKYFATATITSASADENGVATVNFTVADENGDPAPGITGMNFNIVQLQPPSGGQSFNKWVPYIYRAQEVTASSGQSWPIENNGNIEYQGYRENNGTFTDNGNGSYSYVFAQNLSDASQGPAALAVGPIPYDRSLTHRVSVMIGGHSGATADAFFDFVPDGSPITETRDIVRTGVCLDCHGEFEFHGHGGDRLTVENCVTCHNPNQIDPHGGESLDMTEMIHKIHAGGELASIPGPDGIVWDDPDTDTIDESADNGVYAIWGYRNSKHEWWKAAFPAVLQNCTKCHTGDGADGDNWMNVMSRNACGSCHDDIDWATGVGHDGGPMNDDSGCDLCHKDGGGVPSVAEAHGDWNANDPRKVPEYDVAMSVSTPANGTHFVAGESPVVSIVLTDLVTGLPIDHTTVVERGSALGCTPAGCPAADGMFHHAYVFVHGPRALRNPVLTTAARVELTSTTAGPFDLSGGGTLEFTVDGGQDILTSDDGGTILPGVITINVDDGTWANQAAATGAEIVANLNGDDDFSSRMIAYIDSAGMTAVRSRNLGQLFSLQLADGPANTAVFGGNTSTQVVGGYYPSNHLEERASATDDPKAVRTVDKISYTLDPVDDLTPGTYVASTEIAGLGRINGDNYRTPSVAKVTFQVGQAAEEPQVASNCDSCHQNEDGEGFILDFARHYKIFDDGAIDQCAACHDYQNGRATGNWWGGHPISKRVHAVHYGSELNYPNLTVSYNTHDGRNWDITFPQNILNCESCHPATSSGTYLTNATRLPCMGCHDSDSATAHFKLQTYDPTPSDPWSGDEQESCNTCH